ncbi:uncharacterized protein LOC121666760 isoform X4 [Corvus kubaryi]|uniref:uncharacterized protein LOC121666760 isoform X4 n=2 Tax=Corvus TaxID=30420 RepID=UPI001C04C19B|nr:uncharacterized protein LOC121666760 isoform X4 [Corvus kubaryi]XP_041888647.1 uncharacterized protein LOC121666760 isoform X4 [Corvus kubaryi]
MVAAVRDPPTDRPGGAACEGATGEKGAAAGKGRSSHGRCEACLLSGGVRLTMSLPAKRCGRPPMLSFLEKKKRKQSLDRRRGKTRIYVGNHIDRWLTLKEKLDFRNDAEVAGFLLDMYDSYNPLSKATLCPLSEGVRRITVKEARALSASTSLITADGTYDSGDQLLKESACSGFGDVRIVTVKEEEEMLPDCMLTRTADTETQRP